MKEKVDWNERRQRVFDFMKRDARIVRALRLLWFVRNNYEMSEKVNEIVSSSYEIQKKYTNKIIEQMRRGEITTNTQGIWLSYKHTKIPLSKPSPGKPRRYIIELETGEKFEAQKFVIRKRSRKHPDKEYVRYTKLRLIEKINE